MPISISGMHRSGTSMVAKILREGGLFLGELNEIMPAADENPEGFWEYTDIVTLNDVLLGALGGSWDYPPPPPASWDDERLAGIHAAGETIVERFAGLEPWGWKDPRNCLTMPFWNRIAGPLKTVFVIRGPLEVALSLQKRNGFTLQLGLHLWFEYNTRLYRDTTPDNRLITHFDTYFSDPAAEIERLVSFAGLDHDASSVDRLISNASINLKHHTTSLYDLLEARVASDIVDLYVTLCDEAGVTLQGFNQSATMGRATLAGRTTGETIFDVARVNLWFYEQQRRTRDLEVALAVQEGVRSELEGRIRERDGMVLEREGRIWERDTRLADRDRAVSRLTQELVVLRQTITEQSAHIAALTEGLDTAARQEQALRQMLNATQNQLLLKDVEVMGTLGGALLEWAPGAPAAIYYQQLLNQIRDVVNANIPEHAIVLVSTYGDPRMKDLGARTIWEFPRSDDGAAADYTSVNSDAAIAQLQAMIGQGASFLVAPSPAQTWLQRLPELVRFLDANYPVVVHQLGLCTIYRLRDDDTPEPGGARNEGGSR